MITDFKNIFEKIIEKGAADYSDSEEIQNFAFTVLGLQILTVNFADKKSEWTMLANKTNKWIRKIKINYSSQKEDILLIEKQLKSFILKLK